ncbi:MAG: hypothetical protein LBM96_11455 [Methanobrevibacter sp.]|jgi:hypothetical protein|nr:hypothetical protein [Candidatus Methanoflexus mossambicus]
MNKNQILNFFNVFFTVIAMIMVFLMISSVSAITISNDPTDGGIRNAYNKIKSEDSIFLKTGTYFEGNNTNLLFNKNINVIGNSKDKMVIDGQNGRIFTLIKSYNNTFINISFENTDFEREKISFGGTIPSSSDSKADSNGNIRNNYITLINCEFKEFKDNCASGSNYYNDTIYTINSLEFNVEGSNFISNHAIDNNVYSNSGAIYNSNYIIINNFLFKNNAENSSANVIYGNGKDVNINNSNFTNNNTNDCGGAIFNHANILLSKNLMKLNKTKDINGGFTIHTPYEWNLNVLNIEYFGNKTLNGKTGFKIELNATLTDDIKNKISSRNISFYVNSSKTNESFDGGVKWKNDLQNISATLDITLDIIISYGLNTNNCNFTIHIACNCLDEAKNYAGLDVNNNLNLNNNFSNLTCYNEFNSLIFNVQGLSCISNSIIANISIANISVANITFIKWDITLISISGGTIYIMNAMDSIMGYSKFKYNFANSHGDKNIVLGISANGKKFHICVFNAKVNNTTGKLQYFVFVYNFIYNKKAVSGDEYSIFTIDLHKMTGKLKKINDNLLRDRTINFYCDGKYIRSIVTNSEGIAIKYYYITKEYTHFIVKFSVDSSYYSSKVSQLIGSKIVDYSYSYKNFRPKNANKLYVREYTGKNLGEYLVSYVWILKLKKYKRFIYNITTYFFS